MLIFELLKKRLEETPLAMHDTALKVKLMISDACVTELLNREIFATADMHSLVEKRD